jgi:hypothetical protein
LTSSDQLVNGITYTFTFTPVGSASSAGVLADLDISAPSFITAPSVTFVGSQYMNVTFSYTGDGTDVASDVANSMIAAWASGISGSFNLVQVATGANGISAINNNPSAASGPAYSFSFRNLLPSFLGGSTVTTEQQAAYTTEGQAEVGSVAVNAQAGYGAGSNTAVTAVQTAQTQESALVANNATLATAYNNLLAQISAGQLAGLFGMLLLVGAGIAAYLWFMSGGALRSKGTATA